MTKEECAKRIKEKIDDELIENCMNNPDEWNKEYDAIIRPYIERIACHAFNLGILFATNDINKHIEKECKKAAIEWPL